MTSGQRLTRAELMALIRSESERIELKTGAGREPLQKTMVAFSNTAGGDIYIGVDDARTVLGRRRDRGLDDAIHAAATTAHGVGRYGITEIDVAGTPVVRVRVTQRHDEVAQTSDGRVLVRRGGHNHALIGRELHTLVVERSLVRFEATDSGVPADARDLARAQRLAAAFGWSSEGQWPERWQERGLMLPSGALTVAGALVLTDPAESLGTGKFVIDVRTYEDDQGLAYVRRDVIAGALQDQVEAATRRVLDEVGTDMVVTGAVRHDISRLPPRAVREVVANAVAHRAYELDASPVVVEIRPRRVRVTSPGLLPPPVTIATLRTAQAARNHTVIDVLRRCGLAEDSGQGIDLIQDAMRRELLDEAVFAEGEDSVVVDLPLSGSVSSTERGWLQELERTGLLEPGDRLVLLALSRGTRMTNSVARDTMGVDSTQARARLRTLREYGLVLQHGARGGAYYTLGKIGPGRSTEAVVLDLAGQGPLTNTAVREATGLDRVAARRLLAQLVSEGKLTQHGQRRGTTYVRTSGRR